MPQLAAKEFAKSKRMIFFIPTTVWFQPQTRDQVESFTVWCGSFIQEFSEKGTAVHWKLSLNLIQSAFACNKDFIWGKAHQYKGPESLSSSTVLWYKQESSCQWVRVPALYYQSLLGPLTDSLKWCFQSLLWVPPQCDWLQQHGVEDEDIWAGQAEFAVWLSGIAPGFC